MHSGGIGGQGMERCLGVLVPQPVLQSLGDVFSAKRFSPRKVSDRARHPQCPVVRSGAESETFRGTPKEGSPVIIDGTRLGQDPAARPGVGSG